MSALSNAMPRLYCIYDKKYVPVDSYFQTVSAIDLATLARSRARLCAYVKHSTLNSAIEQELRDLRVEHRANATSSA